MAEFLALFILGSFWWYAVSAVFFIWAIILTEKESVKWTLISLTLYLCFFSFLGGINVFSFLLLHPIKALLYVLGYFLIGVIWSFIKWWVKVNKATQKYKKEWDDFIKNYESKKSSVPKENMNLKNLQYHQNYIKRQKEEWESTIRNRRDTNKPYAIECKEKISVWIIYWPFSLFWSFLHDFVKDMAEFFVLKFHQFYQKISDTAYKKVEVNFVNLKENPK